MKPKKTKSALRSLVQRSKKVKHPIELMWESYGGTAERAVAPLGPVEPEPT